MDEGSVIAYAERVLDGAVPHRDFLTFYGPGNPWLVAAAFELFGSDIRVERAVGLLYRIVIVVALFGLARRLGGLVAGVLAGLVAAVLLADEVVWAYATYGSLALGIAGLALAASGAALPPGRRRHMVLFGSGIAAGLAALVRFDFVPAIVVSALPLLAFLPTRGRIWYTAGFVATAGIYVPYLLIVGPERVERVIRDSVASGRSRTLPIPGPWDYPGNLLAGAAVATAVLVVAGGLLTWRRRRDVEGRILLATGLFSAGLFPYALSRADAFHILPVAIVPLSVAPAAALLLLRSAAFGDRVQAALTAVVAAGTLLLGVLLGDPELRRFADPPRIENGDRVFYVDDDSVTAQEIVTLTERLSREGESLFVGPQDLRLADYNPTYLYFLLPKLVPASYYMEMNPDTASREGSGLAGEIRRADWLILTTEFQEGIGSDRTRP